MKSFQMCAEPHLAKEEALVHRNISNGTRDSRDGKVDVNYRAHALLDRLDVLPTPLLQALEESQLDLAGND